MFEWPLSLFFTDKKATNCLGHIFYNYVHEQINNCDLTSITTSLCDEFAK